MKWRRRLGCWRKTLCKLLFRFTCVLLKYTLPLPLFFDQSIAIQEDRKKKKKLPEKCLWFFFRFRGVQPFVIILFWRVFFVFFGGVGVGARVKGECLQARSLLPFMISRFPILFLLRFPSGGVFVNLPSLSFYFKSGDLSPLLRGGFVGI